MACLRLRLAQPHVVGPTAPADRKNKRIFAPTPGEHASWSPQRHPPAATPRLGCARSHGAATLARAPRSKGCGGAALLPWGWTRTSGRGRGGPPAKWGGMRWGGKLDVKRAEVSSAQETPRRCMPVAPETRRDGVSQGSAGRSAATEPMQLEEARCAHRLANRRLPTPLDN